MKFYPIAAVILIVAILWTNGQTANGGKLYMKVISVATYMDLLFQNTLLTHIFLNKNTLFLLGSTVRTQTEVNTDSMIQKTSITTVSSTTTITKIPTTTVADKESGNSISLLLL